MRSCYLVPRQDGVLLNLLAVGCQGLAAIEKRGQDNSIVHSQLCHDPNIVLEEHCLSKSLARALLTRASISLSKDPSCEIVLPIYLN